MAISEDESNSDSDNDSDDEDEEFMLELGKMSKRSRPIVTDMMKNLMKQDQEIKNKRSFSTTKMKKSNLLL
ncbi:hypothetical protein C2845_PM11G27130 [Panicum miliaceum]|uniref:Uncharacterized protein n=1 Tax=Panicum miliaceum TaxID=4540 RepID=A0A3L6RTY9_PANMI|nr:hypothetical protein C2845_PM11G27130 [Panicum miliaceum]